MIDRVPDSVTGGSFAEVFDALVSKINELVEAVNDLVWEQERRSEEEDGEAFSK